MGYDEAYRMPEASQNIILESRRKLSVSSVKDVESFDEETVIMHTSRGTLVVRGEGLNMEKLSLDSGDIIVEGSINSLEYENDGQERAGLFSRLFK